MSGISGVYYQDGKPAGRAILESMLLSIQHRGTDGTGIWSQGPVGLAHCTRWSSREDRHERQPVLSSHADLVLVADARIDNRNDLIKSFGMMDRPASEISNGRLILKAYQTWGEACPEKLEGDFAFAIWDTQLQHIFCARDTAGVKPFYYYTSDHLFAFASEIKALLTIPGLPHRLNEHKLADYLLWSFEDTRDTFYQDIHRLPPASSLVIRQGVQRLRQYWSLDPHREIRRESESAYIESFKGLFGEAVRCRLNGVARIGSTLSGGLDSSSIAITARQLLENKNAFPLDVFSAVFAQSGNAQLAGIDETAFIEEVLKTGGFESHFVDASRLSPLIDPEQLNRVLDEPYFAPTLYLFWGLFQACRQAGVDVLLDGTDGDRTIFHGEEHLTDLARRGQWRAFYRQASALARVQHGSSKIRPLVWQYGVRPFIPSALIRLKRKLSEDRSKEDGWWIIRPEFARKVGYPDSPAFHTVNGKESQLRSARMRHWHELTSGVNALSLELFDKAAGAFAVDMRFPFYDRRLMEYCLALPGELKLSQGWTRYILRASMPGDLPQGVRWRTSKANLFQAFNLQFSLIEKASLDSRFRESISILEPYVNVKRLGYIYDDYWNGPPARIGNAYTVFSAIILASWLKYAGFNS